MRTLTTAIVFAAALLSSVAAAQEPQPGLATGSKALLFSFSGLSNLGAGQFNGGVGGKYYWNDQWALRAGLQFMLASQSIPANPGPGQLGTDGSVSASLFGISAAAEYHLTKTRVTPYLGGELGLSFQSTESKDAVVGPTAQTTTKDNRNGETINGTTYFAGTAITIVALGGVEYFITKEVSLAAEYRFGYSSLSQADEQVTSGNTTVTTKLGSIGNFGFTTAGSLTLAVYL